MTGREPFEPTIGDFRGDHRRLQTGALVAAVRNSKQRQYVAVVGHRFVRLDRVAPIADRFGRRLRAFGIGRVKVFVDDRLLADWRPTDRVYRVGERVVVGDIGQRNLAVCRQDGDAQKQNAEKKRHHVASCKSVSWAVASTQRLVARVKATDQIVLVATRS